MPESVPFTASPRPSSWGLLELPPFPPRTAEWLAGFHRASPSTPLDAYCYVPLKPIVRSPGRCRATDDPLSPRHAEPAQAQDRSSQRALARAVGPAPPERQEARAEIVEAPGLRWINIERPRPADQAWLEERFDFHPLDYEDVFSRNQRPKVDEYDDYLFIVLHFPRYDKRSRA